MVVLNVNVRCERVTFSLYSWSLLFVSYFYLKIDDVRGDVIAYVVATMLRFIYNNIICRDGLINLHLLERPL